MCFPLKTSVRLAAAEAEDVQKIASQGSDEAAALALLTGVALGQKPSAAATLHAVVAAGLKAIEEKAEEIGYTRQAQFEATHPDCVAWRDAMRIYGMQFFDDAVQDGAA